MARKPASRGKRTSRRAKRGSASRTSVARIAFYTLVEKVQRGTITDAETASYFVVQPRFDAPFKFDIGINATAVDVTGVEHAGRMAEGLLHDAMIASDRRPARVAPPAGYKRKTPIIAEGDSWFRYFKETIIDVLGDTHGYPITNRAFPGDTLAQIVNRGQFWRDLTSGNMPDTFLFSAGGNDVVGNLGAYLNPFDPAHGKPSDAPYYVKPEFYANLRNVVTTYRSLLNQLQARAPHVIMLGHGYDYVIPVSGGGSLGNPLANAGHDPEVRPQLCRNIIAVMIDAFNDSLAALAGSYTNFRYVNLLGAIGDADWYNELHPKAAGAKKTAARFDAALRALPASGTSPVPLFDIEAMLRTGRAA
ncbi:MAG TPA: SGNH/GDSL hydrolase family protein [Xanthobacteraceae bacterium]|nr:SGNH/GDSL hydrolase family protein [Xanthobacteraceae bacterium]